MLGVLRFFDAYTVRARIFPALIAGLPSLALPFMLVPWEHIGLSNVVATVMGIILLFAFADVARREGKRVEEKLQTRATPELWHRSNHGLPNVSKDIYRKFIASKLKHPEPSADDEIQNPDKANDFYLSAGNWLRDQTRDTKKFKILFDELLTYGFRRNLLGLKVPALVMNSLVAVTCCGLLYYMPSYFSAIPRIDEKLFIIVIVVVFHSAYMLAAVSKQSVREASKAYGKQLILSCELLMKPARAPRAKTGKA